VWGGVVEVRLGGLTVVGGVGDLDLHVFWSIGVDERSVSVGLESLCLELFPIGVVGGSPGTAGEICPF